MRSYIRAEVLRAEIKAQRESVETDDAVTRARQASEDLLAEMEYVLAGLVNEEQDWPADGLGEYSWHTSEFADWSDGYWSAGVFTVG